MPDYPGARTQLVREMEHKGERDWRESARRLRAAFGTKSIRWRWFFRERSLRWELNRQLRRAEEVIGAWRDAARPAFEWRTYPRDKELRALELDAAYRKDFGGSRED